MTEPTNGRRPLVLASASPRRRRLLELLGIPFTQTPSRVDEVMQPGEAPRDFALRAAREKCLAVAGELPRPALVLGADTIVCFEEAPAPERPVLGKPRDPEDAMAMLRLLSGRTHQVITAIALSRPGEDSIQTETETSHVAFRPITEEEIRSYILTDEPHDKAGAYALQGDGAQFVRSVRGDLFNVVGLPVGLLVRMLAPDYPGLAPPDRQALLDFLGKAGRLLPEAP